MPLRLIALDLGTDDEHCLVVFVAEAGGLMVQGL